MLATVLGSFAPGLPSAQAQQVIEIGSGVYRSPTETLLLIEVETSGFGGKGVKYFAVKTSALLGKNDGEGKNQFVQLGIEVIPISKELEGVLKGQLRVLPFQLARELGLGYGKSAKFEVIGWTSQKLEAEGSDADGPDASPENSAEAQKRFSALGEVAIDAIGLSSIGLSDGRRFQGAELARVELEKGIRFQINPRNSITLVFGIGADVAYGRLDHATDLEKAQGFALGTEMKVELQYAFELMKAHYTAFLRCVYERFDFLAGSDPIHNREVSIQLGVSREFKFKH